MKDYTEAASAGSMLHKLDSADRMVIVQGLLYGIAHINSLPSDRHEGQSKAAMCKIVRAIMDTAGIHYVARILWGVEHHAGVEIDLWPNSYGPGPFGTYSEADVERSDIVTGMIDEWKERFARTGLLADAPPSDVVKFLEGEAA